MQPCRHENSPINAAFTLGNVQISYDASRGEGFAQTARVPSYGGGGFGQIVI